MDKGGALPGQPRAATAASDSPQNKGGSLLSAVSPSVLPATTAAGAESYQSDRVKEMAAVEPIDVVWEHVSLRVPVKGSKTKKAVLSDVSGRVQAAQVSAIMGASGCGKTSLLNVLAGRVQAVKGGELSGRLLTNNKVREEGDFRKLAGYVTQDDTLYACLTVQETLMLAAFFKLGKKLGPGKALEDYVTGVINDLGLKKCRNTAIGDAMIKGVSGGERKRVSIGVEMISNPSVLFLDEPTSGLDSFQALAVMSALKELAGTQRTIVTVIHQPRSSIFAMLDRLVLLSEGRTIYVGPAADAPLYFHRQGFTCPAHSSPADYLLDVVAKDFRTSKLEALSQQRIDVLTQAYEEHCRTEQAALVPASGDGKEKELVVSSLTEVRRMVSDDGASYGAGWWTQVRFLAWRNVIVASRNKIGRIVGLALPTFFGLLFGAIWSNRDTDPQKAIQDRIGLMFMATILMGFMGMSETLQTFPIEKRTVQKERASGFYSLSAYYAAKVVTNVPFAVAGPIIFCCIVYPAADMRAGFEHFLVWLAVIVGQVVAACSLGMFLSSIASDPEIANAMAPAFNIIFTVFNGVLINVNDLPSGTKWLAIIGYNRWAFEALAINEFRDRPYSCGSAVNPGTCVTNGDQILKLYTYDQGSVVFCLLWIVVICLVIHSLAYFNLWRNATTYLKMRIPAAKPLPAPVLGEETSVTVRAIAPSKEEEEEALEEVNERGGGAANMAPVPAVNVSWQDITLKVSGGKARPPKVVLDDVSGEVRTGTLTAIMGPTGSGKSSLLMVLAGRVVQAKGMELTGTLLTNKIPRDAASFRNISAFVTQDDLLFGHLTVSETLVLAAHFALGSSITPPEKAKLVRSIVDEMGLAKTLHTIIGDDRARGVSGGERKRVSIGVELISNPSVLFLDEPTSGLDSFQAQSVMAALKKLAGTQRTIVTVIHQPRSSIFTILDELILISEGRTIFIGPAEKAARHFAAQGFVCPPQYNAADLFLDSISMDYRTEALEHVTRARIAQLADTWRDHPYPDDNDEASDTGSDAPELVRGPSCKDLAAASYISPQDRGGWFNNLYYLTWRAGKSAYRNNFAIGLRILLNVMFALIFSGIWHDVQNTQTGIQSLVGIIFMCATNVAFTNTQAVINSFPREKGIVQKEQASNAYSLSAYYLSKFFSELPLNLLGPTIFSSMVFWIVHFNHSLANYGIFLATMCLSALSAIGLGTLISTLAPNMEVAAALSPVFNVLFLLFSGVLINTESLPAGARWVASISPIKWTVNALALNEFTGAKFACTEAGQRCLARGEEVLSLYSWDDATIGHSMLSIVIIMCCLLTLGYVVLRLSLPRYIKAEEKEEDNHQQQQPSEKQEAEALAVVS